MNEQYRTDVANYGICAMTPREILATNLKALMERNPRFKSCPAVERGTTELGHKIGRTTVQQVLDGKTPFNLDHLHALSQLFGLDPWQLLTPGMDPKNPPVLKSIGDSERKLYARLDELLKEVAPLMGNSVGGDDAGT